MPSAKILCILPHATHPLFARRIEMLRAWGYQVEVMAFEGGSFYHGHSPGWPVTLLGRIQPRRYSRRIPTLARAIPQIRAGIRRNQLIYASSTDLALAAQLAGLGLGRPVILDIVDILELQVARSLAGRLMRSLDRFTVARCRLLTMTSAGYRHYYRDWLRTKTPCIALPEKIEAARRREAAAPALSGLPFRDRPTRIGCFSVIRDWWPMKIMEILSKTSPGRFEFLLVGPLSSKVRRQAFDDFLARNPEIEYRSGFRYPDDLPALYGSVDMVLASYPPEIPHGWSRSTRFYEACFFKKPLIARAGTGDGEEVEREGIGLVFHDRRPEDAARVLEAVTLERWQDWRANLATLPEQIYMQGDESEALARALEGLLHA